MICICVFWTETQHVCMTLFPQHLKAKMPADIKGHPAVAVVKLKEFNKWQSKASQSFVKLIFLHFKAERKKTTADSQINAKRKIRWAEHYVAQAAKCKQHFSSIYLVS